MTFCNIYPTYCPNCEQLMFIGKHENHSLSAIEYDKSNWIPHNCTDDNRHIYENEIIIEYINENETKAPVPFQWVKGKKDYNRKILRPGIVLSVVYKDDSNPILKVITVDNKLLTIKIVKKAPEIKTGNIIDLKKATRIGSNRYRIPEIYLIEIPSRAFDQETDLSEFYKINISSFDQEKLELFIGRVLQHFKQHQISVFGIIPLPIDPTSGENRYTRQVFIKPINELVQKIQLLHLPEVYDISIEQIKIKT